MPLYASNHITDFHDHGLADLGRIQTRLRQRISQLLKLVHRSTLKEHVSKMCLYVGRVSFLDKLDLPENEWVTRISLLTAFLVTRSPSNI